MRVVSYNIQYTRGKEGRCDVARIAESVRGADVIALQEVMRFEPSAGMNDQPVEIADRLSERYWVYGPETDLHSCEPAASPAKALRRQYGNMLLSRWPILSTRNLPLPYIGTSTHGNASSCALEAVIDVGARALRVYSLHLSHLSRRERLAQVDALLDLNRRATIDGIGQDLGPYADMTFYVPLPEMPFDALYLGDFNFTPRDPEYERIVGPYEVDHGRVGYRDQLVDAWVAAGHREEDGITHPGSDSRACAHAGRRIDYCFVTSTLRSCVRSARIDAEAQGSDHQPVWFEFEFDLPLAGS